MPQNVGYFSYAWGLLKRDKGWPKVILLLGLAMLVPVVGWLGVAGYIYEWGRLTAWGVDAAPKQSGVQIGECIKSGWRVFVSRIGWGVVWGLVAWFVGLVPVLGSIVVIVVGIFVETFLTVCAIRAEIYQDFTAGYQINRIYEMIKRDFKGFAKVTGISLLMGLVLGVVLALVSMIGFAGTGASFIGTVGSTGSHYSTQAVARILGSFFVVALIVVMIGLFFRSWIDCITTNMVALWMRQFNVPAWGASGDPLPWSPTLPTGGASAAPQATPQQQPLYGYGQPQQAAPQQQPAGYQQPYAQPQAQPQPYQQPVGYQPQAAPQQSWQPYQQPAPQPVAVPLTPQQAAMPDGGYPVAAPQGVPAATPVPAPPAQPAPAAQPASEAAQPAPAAQPAQPAQPAAPQATPASQPAPAAQPAQPAPAPAAQPASEAAQPAQPVAPQAASTSPSASEAAQATPAPQPAVPPSPAPEPSDDASGTPQQ